MWFTLKLIKKIPDTSINNSVERFMAILSDYKLKEIKQIVRLAKKYPPSTRALLGALLDALQLENYSEELHKSLNPITKYSFLEINNELLPTKKWNLK